MVSKLKKVSFIATHTILFLKSRFNFKIIKAFKEIEVCNAKLNAIHCIVFFGRLFGSLVHKMLQLTLNLVCFVYFG